jgi:hypothetical protein
MTHIANMPKKGRDLNHLEDYVFFYGSHGTKEAIDILMDMTSGTHDISIKWDGKVALFYGRDASGVFQMGTRGNWAKDMPATSAQGMHDYIMQTGKGESFRPAMARDLQILFPYLEGSVPLDFSGFVMGDLLFSPCMSPALRTANGIEFTPNQVTYTVNTHSLIGDQINNAVCGMALHVQFPEWKSTKSIPLDNATVQALHTTDVYVTGQNYSPVRPRVGLCVLYQLKALAAKNNQLLDALIAKRLGLSDVSDIIYTFNNQTMRSGGNVLSPAVFFEWLSRSKISNSKQAKLLDMGQNEHQSFSAMFELFNAVAAIKNDIISQLEAGETDIKTSTNGVRGGEGYVSLKHKVKLVPRTTWRPLS